MLKLRHVYLTRPHYLHVGALQDFLVRQHLDFKASVSRDAASTDAESKPNEPPPPTLLTFQTYATYTCGRRDMNKMTPAQMEYLRANDTWFFESPRGGQLTFHGIGQLTAYLICDLKRHNLTPRTHVRLLEEAVQAVCTKWKLETYLREEYPGVWIKGETPEVPEHRALSKNPLMRQRYKRIRSIPNQDEDTSYISLHRDERDLPAERKICSLGVHLRRNISSFGVGLNAKTQLGYFQRIEACGLPGSYMTSIEAEGGWRSRKDRRTPVNKKIEMELVGKYLAREIATRLDGVEDDAMVKTYETDLWDKTEDMVAWDSKLRKDHGKFPEFSKYLSTLQPGLPNPLVGQPVQFKYP